MAIRNLTGPILLPSLASCPHTAVPTAVTDDSPTRPKLTAATQIEQWLVHGIYPESIFSPVDADLQQWLESQSDEDWLDALRRCGPKEQAIQRIINRSTPFFFERVVRIIARS